MSVREERRGPSTGTVERVKWATDALKHMTTLNAGSIVVIGTFLADIFPNKDGTVALGLGLKLTIAAAFFFFGFSLIVGASGVILFSVTGVEPGRFQRFSFEDRLLWVIASITIYSFVLGLLCFGSAVLINLF